MKDEFIVRCGRSGLRVVGSPLHLEHEALPHRITALDGTAVAGNAGGLAEAQFPAIQYFSIPRHLLEALWLEEIPKLTGVTEASSDAAQVPERWAGLDTLAVLLATIDDSFVRPVDAVFQSSPAAMDAHEDSDRDICDRAASAAPRLGEPCPWLRAAWLNLDEHSHRARLRVLDPQHDRRSNDQPIVLEIAGGEGILWQRDRVRVTEADATTPETSNKLILLAGRASES